MAFKNLARQKRRTLLLGGAIAFGLAVVTVVNGLSDGAINTLESNLSNLVAGNIFISGTQKLGTDGVEYRIGDDAPLLRAIKELHLPYAYLSKESLVRQAALISDSSTVYLTLYGVELGPKSFLRSHLSIVEGSLDGVAQSDGILISEASAKKLDVKLGDRISVQTTTTSGQQNVLDFTVRAIYRSIGVADSLSGAYADLDRVNTLLNLPPGDYNELSLYLKDLGQSEVWGQRLYDQLKADGVPLWPRSSDQNQIDTFLREGQWTGTKYLLQTLGDQLSIVQGLFSALNFVALLILLLLYLVIMVGITNTYRMIVWERTREIGTLRALGMQRNEIRNLFLLEAVFLGLGGIVSGFVIGVGVMGLLTIPDLSVWKDFTILLHNNHLSPAIDLGFFLVDLLLVTALTALAASFPARKAARLEPAVALRSTF
jgi:putative ABC transport system permease protein